MSAGVIYQQKFIFIGFCTQAMTFLSTAIALFVLARAAFGLGKFSTFFMLGCNWLYIFDFLYLHWSV